MLMVIEILYANKRDQHTVSTHYNPIVFSFCDQVKNKIMAIITIGEVRENLTVSSKNKCVS